MKDTLMVSWNSTLTNSKTKLAPISVAKAFSSFFAISIMGTIATTTKESALQGLRTEIWVVTKGVMAMMPP